MGPDFDAAGNLPRGRWFFSLADAEARFVTASEFAGSCRRSMLWANLQTAIAAIHTLKVRIPSLFLGGSFSTHKLDPDDIDVTFIVDNSVIRNPQTWGRLEGYVGGLEKIGLGVQGFLLPWGANGAEWELNQNLGYLAGRGKWDDWWQRDVPKLQRNSPVRSHSLPKRGYVEVEVDGYR